MTTEDEREAFEQWISAPPFEKSVETFGEQDAWPGNYWDYAVELAWCAWKACVVRARAEALEEAAEECDALASVEGIAQRCAAAIRARATEG